MIHFVCMKCGMTIRTVGDSDEIANLLLDPAWYPENYPCPRAGCEGKAKFTESIDSMALAAMEIHDLSPQETFIAFQGMGLPEERDCGRTAVELLLQKPLIAAGLAQLPGKNRTVVTYLEFLGGERMYLASAVEGAVVYRISKPRKHAEEVLNDCT